MNDVILVGGGLSGLAAATFCARAGLRVNVIERAAALGGRAQTDRDAGHAFNQGGHALYIRGAAARILRELGVAFSGKRSPTRGLFATARGAVHRLPSGLVSMLATDLYGFGAKIETARALATIARTDPRGLRDVPWSTWVETVATRPEVRDGLAALMRVTTYAHAPERASAGATIAQMKIGLAPGVLYLDGGWQTLVDGLERAARSAGATITTAARVVSITRDETGARGFSVTLANGDVLSSRAVILATGPATARALLGVPSRSLGADLVPVHAACLDVGLASLPRPERLFALGIDRPTYFSVHSASARLAETGATVHLMKYLSPGEPHDARADERELEDVFDLVQPGWRERVVARRFLPNLVATNALVAAGTRRPEPAVAEIEGALVAGDWVGEEGMLADTALASARAAAEGAIRFARRTPAPSVRRSATPDTLTAS